MPLKAVPSLRKSTFNHAMMTVPHHISQTSELASGVISRRNRTLLSGYFIGPKGYAEQRIKKREFGIPVQITLSGRDDLNNHTRLTFARLSTNLELRSSVPEAGDSTLSQPYYLSCICPPLICFDRRLQSDNPRFT